MEKKLICRKCKHEWTQRGCEKPKVCPSCKNPNWNKVYAEEFISMLFHK